MKLGAIIAIAPLTAVGLINDAVISICQSWPHGYWVSGLIREEVGRLRPIRTRERHERLLRLFKRLLWPNECNSCHWSFRRNRSNDQTKHSGITKTWPIGFECGHKTGYGTEKINILKFTVYIKNFFASACSEVFTYALLLLSFLHKMCFSSPITQYP